MQDHVPHRVSISWEVTPLELATDGYITPECRKCHAILDIHQPDEDHPSNLLGTCRCCGTWYMIEVSRDGSEAFLYNMPGVELVRRKLAEAGRLKRPRRVPETDLESLLPTGMHGYQG